MKKLKTLLVSSVLLASTAVAQELVPTTTPAQLLKSAEAQQTVELIHLVCRGDILVALHDEGEHTQHLVTQILAQRFGNLTATITNHL